MTTDLMLVNDLTVSIPDFDPEALAAPHRKTLEQLKAFAVTSAEDSQFVADIVAEAKTTLKGLDDSRTAYVKPMNDAVKAINAAFGTVTGVLAEIETTGKASISTWQRAEQERLRQEQIKRDAEAAAERQRLAAEAAAAAAQASKLEEQAQQNPETAQGDAALQQAMELRSTAAVAHVEAMNTRAAPVVATKLKGTSVRENWQAELEDKAALIKYLVDHPEYHDLFILDSVVARNIAKVQKGNCQIPGLRVWDQGSVSIRTAPRRAA